MKPLIIAHRGYSKRFPENTLSAFEQALSAGANGIELDIQLSRDGVPMVIHDDTLERTTSGSGKVRAMDAAQLQELDAGLGERIPTLQEVLEQVGKRATLFIELKDPDSAMPVAELVEVHAGDACIISFQYDALKRIRARYPSIALSVSAEEITQKSWDVAQEIHAKAMIPDIKKYSANDVLALHEKGLRGYYWTCNTEEQIRKALDCEVDGIIGDDVALLKAMIG